MTDSNNKFVNLVNFKKYLIIGLCQIVLIVVALFIYDASKNIKSIGVVNITGIVNEFIDTQTKQNLSVVDLKARVKIFSAFLEKTMNDLSAKKNVILMPAEAVITGAKDYTKAVQKQLAAATRELFLEKQQEVLQERTQEKQPILQETSKSMSLPTQTNIPMANREQQPNPTKVSPPGTKTQQ